MNRQSEVKRWRDNKLAVTVLKGCLTFLFFILKELVLRVIIHCSWADIFVISLVQFRIC